MNLNNINTLWADLIVTELIRCGSHIFCISPGSRSTPLAVAIAQNTQAQSFIAYDERGAAFYALGVGKATKQPAILVCTSGTAVANYLPAVIEAAADMVPLCILSADRPPELRLTGANQTIEQNNIFAPYVRWKFDMPCPDNKIAPQMVLTTIDQAIYQSLRNPCGPVHINCMFREPLVPVVEESEEMQKIFAGLEKWKSSDLPYTLYSGPTSHLSKEFCQRIVAEITQATTGMVVIGQISHKDRDAVLILVKKLGWPVCADIRSGLRLGTKFSGNLHYFDWILPHIDFIPQCILHIGRPLISKNFYQYIEKSEPQCYIVVDDHSFRHDPLHRVNLRIESDISAFCNYLENYVNDINSNVNDRLIEIHNTVAHFISECVPGEENITEPDIAYMLGRKMPDQSALFIANSMPVRYMDMYTDGGGNCPAIGTNRGASGIDGTIATAAGFALGLKRLTTLIIGDLAFIHDINSLHLLNQLPYPLWIVVVNNHGGRIFSLLPIANFPEVFNKHFTTPHNLNFCYMAEMFSLFYCHVKTNEQFKDIYPNKLPMQQSAIIEVEIAEAELDFHLQLRKKVAAVVKDYQY